MNYQSELFGSWPMPNHCKTEARKRSEASARTCDPSTSKAAARSQSPEGLTETKRLILGLLREQGPMPDVGIKRELDRMGHRVSDSGARTRRSSLVHAGLVVDSGERVKLPESGRAAIVWKVAG